MRPEFDWNEANEDKLLLRHDVTAEEAEQCFDHPRSIRRKGDVYLMLGRTDGDRLLFLVFERTPTGKVRVFSARDMRTAERRKYRQLCK
jgi:uncharacterized DUF497 family protein